MSSLAWLYTWGEPQERDYKRALVLYSLAAHSGDPAAMNNLGQLYETVDLPGDGDLGRAADWYRRSAEAGFAPAQFNLGRMYAEGKGVAADTAKAATWMGKAADQGLQEAARALDWLQTRGQQGPPG
jgi:TPR repeat protein